MMQAGVDAPPVVIARGARGPIETRGRGSAGETVFRIFRLARSKGAAVRRNNNVKRAGGGIEPDELSLKTMPGGMAIAAGNDAFPRTAQIQNWNHDLPPPLDSLGQSNVVH
jgi:hypothetical protein